MDDAKRDHDWQQSSWIIALLYNANRPKGKRALTPDEINPVARANAGKMTPKESTLSMAAAWGIEVPGESTPCPA